MLLTGAAGFLGGHVRALLLARGHEIVGLASSRGVSGDLRDGGVVRRTLEGWTPEVVVHLAARAVSNRPGAAWDDVYLNNVESTRALLCGVLEAAPSARVVVASSSAVYGRTSLHGRALRECDPLFPTTLYGASKVACEALASALAQHGQRATVCRAFNFVGPGGDTRSALGQWARRLVAIERGLCEPVLRCGPLDTRRDLTDVRDVASAYVALVERAVEPDVLNVCSGDTWSGEELLQVLLEETRLSPEIRSTPRRPEDLPYQCGDATLASRQLGWSPGVPLEQTIREVLAEQRALDDNLLTPTES